MEELHQAIQTVFNGGAMINPDIAIKVFKAFSELPTLNNTIKVFEDEVESLSKAEWKIIQQVGFGLSNREIAQKLFLSEGTVRNYLSNVLAKLQLRDRTQLAIWSVQTGVTVREIEDDDD